MKSPSRAAWVVTMLLLFGCALEGAPFPSSFRITGPGQFEFIARGNWINPANTTAGETERRGLAGTFRPPNLSIRVHDRRAHAGAVD